MTPLFTSFDVVSVDTYLFEDIIYPEAANSDLHEQNHGDRDQGTEQCSEPDWHNLVTERISKFRVDYLAILEVDRERSRGRWMSLFKIRMQLSIEMERLNVCLTS